MILFLRIIGKHLSINRLGIILGLILTGCNSHVKPLPDQEPHFTKGNLIYENSFAERTMVGDWKIEGPGKLEFRNGWMEMSSPQEEYHQVFWCPENFPDSFMAEWEVQNLETDGGLCIIFFAAMGLNGESVLDSNLPERDGTFSDYTQGKINNYHISYYANNPEYEKGRGFANLRKNQGFDLVQSGNIGIPVESKDIHKVKLVKDGSHIVMWVDHSRIIDWTDDGVELGSILKSGKIGFRQMKWTHFRYKNFKVWNLVK